MTHDASQASEAQKCPIDHRALHHQKTLRDPATASPAVERDTAGVWHIRGYKEAQALLRGSGTKQAGFKAELLEKVPTTRNPPILYLEGTPHHEQRRLTARFFTPKAVHETYQPMIETFVAGLIREMVAKKRVNFTKMSMKLATRVASEVIGLTNSRIPGMSWRIDRFFDETSADAPVENRLMKSLQFILGRSRALPFFFLDVKPAIEARRKQPREDIISHLLSQNANDAEIMTECITYAAAGMVTTREFVSIALLHLLEQPRLRDEYLASTAEERLEFLQEILRIEPVVNNLYRRATEDVTLEHNGSTVTIPKGSLINIHLTAINVDEAIVGEYPNLICPFRDIKHEKAGPAVMSFGDGHHRCPGSYIAIQETDILLKNLLGTYNVKLIQKPLIRWNSITAGYELCDFIISVTA